MAPSIPPATSASQLVSYSLCPRAYAALYVYGQKPAFKSMALALGGAVHSAIGWWFSERIARREPPLGAAEEVLCADLLAVTSDGNVRWKKSSFQELEAQGRSLVRLYLEKHSCLPVVGVEEPFSVDLVDPRTGEVMDRPLKGYFDLVLENRGVIELKTSSRSWTEHELKRHLQVGAYAYAWNTLHGGPSDLEVHVMVKLKREPRIERFHIERGETGLEWWFDAMREIEDAIAEDHFPPAPSPRCMDCEYEQACREWSVRVPRKHPRDAWPPQNTFCLLM